MDNGLPKITDLKERIRLKAMTESAAIRFDPDGPANADRIAWVRDILNDQKADVFSGINYQELYTTGNAHFYNLGYQFCALRIQVVEALLLEHPEESASLLPLRKYNYNWLVRYREAVARHNLSIGIQHEDDDTFAETLH